MSKSLLKHITFQDLSHKQLNFGKAVISLKRVTKVVAGGRKFGFSAFLAAGNKNGMIGIGRASAREAMNAFNKAFKQATSNMIFVPRCKDKRTIFRDVVIKFCSTTIILKRAKDGSGIKASSQARYIFELAGITDVTCKVIGSSQKINVVYGLICAFEKMNIKLQQFKSRLLENNYQNTEVCQ